MLLVLTYIHVCFEGVMLDSMFASMTTSMQLAQECLRHEPTEGEQVADTAQPFEGLEVFAQTIEAGIWKVPDSLYIYESIMRKIMIM